MKEKNKAVIANIAIRALCCFGAVSFGYCFPDNRVGPQNGIIKRKQKQRFVERQTYSRYVHHLVGVQCSSEYKQWANYELHSLIKQGKTTTNMKKNLKWINATEYPLRYKDSTWKVIFSFTTFIITLYGKGVGKHFPVQTSSRQGATSTYI